MIEDTPLISVCIITYNQEDYIEKCLKGAIEQNFKGEYEIVIGEDYSTDKTREICKKYSKNYPDRIRLIERPENIGVMKNFISTLILCRGKYIAICEGDDYWTDTNKLQKQFDAMEKNLDINLSFHQCDILDSTSLPHIKPKKFTKYQDLEIVGLKDVIRGNGGLIPMASIFFRSSILNNYLKYVEKYTGGHYLLQVIGSLNGALFLQHNMAVYRKNSSTSIIKNVKNNAIHNEFWIHNHIQKLNDFKKITGGNYNNLIDGLILKEKLNAFRSFKISKKYRKELYKELIITRDLSYQDRIIYNLIFKNKYIKKMIEKVYRLLK
ncbi:glycosyltransferase [Gramella sp. AN32]|uniref:Glycosyltransferase family 2 protein n=1 Tax=Christiangramia antarctica TaxID=2058158 RepID=A0ABW5X1R8_9FLAO|nr:glycosyltransferase [Gramella sp. AN32]MCM4157120.1 hypothetical protein [Gramella sp. AN32]